nr:ComEC/Rec2 family competence protein [Desulfacinum infernum]
MRLVVRDLEGDWRVGDVFAARLKLRSFRNFENPGRFDYVAFQARQGIFARAFLKTDRAMERLPGLFRLSPQTEPSPIGKFEEIPAWLSGNIHRWVDGMRQRSRRAILQALEGGTAAVNCALLLGYRHMIPPERITRFREAGVMHLLAISGLHVGIVAWVAFWAVRLLLRLLFPRLLETVPDVQAGWAAALAAAALYALLAGLALPTQRALCMLGLAVAAVWSFRRPDPLSLTAAAALAVLASDPWNLFRASFQLSFAAFLGIALLYPRMSRRVERRWPGFRSGKTFWLRPFVDAFLLSAAATVAVTPLSAYHFHGLSLVGLAANTLVVPVMGLAVLPSGLAGLAFHPVLPGTGSLLLKLSGGVLHGALKAVDAFADLPFAHTYVGRISVGGLIACYGSAWLLLSSLPVKKKAALAAALGITAGAVWLLDRIPDASPPSPLRVTVLHVGQGSSTLVRCGRDGALLVDGGGFYDDSFDVGRAVVAPALWALGVRRLDWVVLSHDQADHRNGLKFILKHFPVGRYLESGLTDDASGETPTAAIAGKRGIPVLSLMDLREENRQTNAKPLGPFPSTPLPAGSFAPPRHEPPVAAFPLGDCRAWVLHPSRDYVERVWDGVDLNEVSVVLAVTYGKTGVLIPGDISTEVEAHALARLPKGGLRWILVAPHHGSAHSTGPALLDALRPQAVLVSCGHLNPFRFPASAFLERCRTRDIPVLRTDRHGALFAESDGLHWKLRTFSGGRPDLTEARCGSFSGSTGMSFLPAAQPFRAARRLSDNGFFASFCPHPSSPRKRGSRIPGNLWTPACAGVTGGGVFGQPPSPSHNRKTFDHFP